MCSVFPMKIYRPSDREFDRMKKAMNRRAIPEQGVREAVAGIISEVASRGDAALVDYSLRFDKVHLTPAAIHVTEEELAEAEAAVPLSVKEAIAMALSNIAYFTSQSCRKDWKGYNNQGVEVGERFVPFGRVGIYVPGGKAPLVSTSMMTGGFAKAVGVPEIVAATSGHCKIICLILN